MARGDDFTEEDLAEVFTWSAVRAARRLERLFTEVLAEFDLTPVQFGVLIHLSVRPAITQAALARDVLVRPQSMGALLAGLEARGLVSRSPLRGRGRRNPLAITDAGEHLLRMTWAPVKATNDLSAFGIDEATAARVNEALLRIATAETGDAPDGGARPDSRTGPR